jgi:hypothetical protein
MSRFSRYAETEHLSDLVDFYAPGVYDGDEEADVIAARRQSYMDELHTRAADEWSQILSDQVAKRAEVTDDWERDLLEDSSMSFRITLSTLVDLARLYMHRDDLTSAEALDQAVNTLKIMGVTRDLFTVTHKAARVLAQDTANSAGRVEDFKANR